jgi:hypothetical protein
MITGNLARFAKWFNTKAPKANPIITSSAVKLIIELPVRRNVKNMFLNKYGSNH